MVKKLSGRFVLRTSPEIHSSAKRRAAQLDISLNELCLRALEAYLTQDTMFSTHTTTMEDPDISLEGNFVRRAKQHMGNDLKGLLLFGSTARGESRDGSDVDLLIVVGRELTLTRQLYTRWDREFTEGRLSPHFTHLPSSLEHTGSIWFEVAVDGILLFERERSISRFLSKIRRAIATGLLVRKTAYGHPYWLRNEGEQANVQ